MSYLERLKGGGDSQASAPPRPLAGKKKIVIRDIVPPARWSRTRVLSSSAAKNLPPATKEQYTAKPEVVKAATESSEETSLGREIATPETERRAGMPSSPAPFGREWRVPSSTAQGEAPKPPPEFIVERELPVRTWEPESRKRSRFKKRMVAGTALGGLMLAFLVPTFAFPKLSIVIIPKIRTAAIGRMEFIGDTAIATPDISSRRIPAMSITLDRTITQEYAATGKKYIEAKAKGRVTIFNAFSSSPQTLAPNTRFQDPSGKIYRLREGIIIPGAKVVEGKIVPTSITAALAADAAGEDYNIGAAELRIAGFRGTPKYEGFFAKAESGFSGGFKGETAVVLADDLTQASQDITRRVFAELGEALQNKIPTGEDFVVPSGGREIIVTKITQPNAGEPEERFTLTVSAEGRLAALRRSHLNEVILSAIPKSQGLGTKFPMRQPKINLGEVRFRGSPTQLTFAASGEFVYWHEKSQAELIQTLINSTPEKAKAYLRSREEIDALEIKKFPRWLWFIPQRLGGFEIAFRTPL